MHYNTVCRLANDAEKTHATGARYRSPGRIAFTFCGSRRLKPDMSDPGLRSRLQHAEALKAAGSYEAAISAFENILQLALGTSDTEVVWTARHSLGFLRWNIGRMEASEKLFLSALESAEESGSLPAIEASREALAIVQTYQRARAGFNADDLSAARSAFEEGIRKAETLNAPEFTVKFLRQLSMVSWAESKYPEFHDLNRRALALARTLNHSLEISRCLNNIGLYFWKIDEYEKALDAYEESLRLARETSNIRTETDCLHNISMIQIELGNFEKALEYAERALKMEVETGDTANLALEYSNMGTIYRRLSQWTENPEDSEKALAYFAKGLDFARKTGSRIQETVLLNNIATVLSDRKEIRRGQNPPSRGSGHRRRIAGPGEAGNDPHQSGHRSLSPRPPGGVHALLSERPSISPSNSSPDKSSGRPT
jgi:tetratricopeptide (TPR) repeat protein